MTGADTVTMLAVMKTAFPQAVVTVAVSVSDNETITVSGVRSNSTIARVIQKGGLSNNTDLGVWVPAASFSDIYKLPGCKATITDSSNVATSGRLLPVRLHALGGLVNLAIGESDRVVQ